MVATPAVAPHKSVIQRPSQITPSVITTEQVYSNGNDEKGGRTVARPSVLSIHALPWHLVFTKYRIDSPLTLDSFTCKLVKAAIKVQAKMLVGESARWRVGLWGRCSDQP